MTTPPFRESTCPVQQTLPRRQTISRARAGGFYIPLEPALLIPFIISLKNNSSCWNDFDPNNNEEQIPIGTGLPIAEEPSLVTVRTDRVCGDPAVKDGDCGKAGSSDAAG